jgi:dTDP-4-dehydrorhamnose reductase
VRPENRVILVTGGTGQVGHELQRELALLGRVVAPGRDLLDLATPASIRAVMDELRPAVVINAGAYTAVDRAESDPVLCEAVNATAPGVLAEESARRGALLVHYSTDYVFDGRSAVPYTEGDATNPLSVYGATKLAGEQAIQRQGGSHLIFRTSWVYGLRGANFLRTIRRLACERKELRIVSDQIGAPTWSRTIAAATAHVLKLVLPRAGRLEPTPFDSGVYHLTSAGAASWFDFARAIVESDPIPDARNCRIEPIPSDEYPTAARRPAMSLLDSNHVVERFGLTLPDWRDQLALVLGDLSI